MDAYEATRIVLSRIQSLEPDNASKIMGYLLLQDTGDQEMIRLAFCPDAMLQTLITKAKIGLGLMPIYNSNLALQISQIHNNSSPSRPIFPAAALSPPHGMYWGPPPQLERQSSLPFSALPLQQLPQVQEHHNNYLNFRSEKALQVAIPAPPTYHHEQLSLFNDAPNSHTVFPADFLYPDMVGYHGNKLNCDVRAASSSVSDMVAETAPGVWKPCVYFARGYCKHGSNCRFLHGYARPESNTAGSMSSMSGSPTECRSVEEVLQSGSLERLEIELQELLRGKRMPISIAALPQLYYERYGKTLQAEGYLTESQRHGKAGYSLTKLLARLKNTVTLIDRPHGQHAVVLAEDAHRFTAYSGIDDGMNSGSRQIYLTFPAESTFTEEDVSDYFRSYGPVHDVRIPYQQKRMFGFVTFKFPETVKMILAKGNPHYVCGARVLVKPYREKGKVGDRKFADRGEQPKFVSSNNFDARDYEQMNFGLRMFDNSEIIRRHMEEQEQVIELERRRFAELHLTAVAAAAAKAQRLQQQQQQLAEIQASTASTAALASHALQNIQATNGVLHSEEESKAVEDPGSFPSTDHFEYLLEVLENNEDEPTQESNVNHGSCDHNLPESLFATITGSNGNGTLYNSNETEISEGKSTATITKTSGQASSASVINKELACSICLDALVDPKQLECNHAFCLKCMPKVGEMANIVECPICGQHKYNQFIKLPKSKDLQDFLGKPVIKLPESKDLQDFLGTPVIKLPESKDLQDFLGKPVIPKSNVW